MGVMVVETDFGTKRATLLKLDEMMNEKDEMFKMQIFKFWQKVYYRAIQECPKDTGALAASIRLRKAGTDVSPPAGNYGVSLMTTDYSVSWYITAGGAGVINPKHGREVDYAQAVHNGYRDASGKWHPPNPFLTRAFQKENKELFKTMKEIKDWFSKKWSQGAMTRPPAEFFVRIPVGISGTKGIYNMSPRMLRSAKDSINYVQ